MFADAWMQIVSSPAANTCALLPIMNPIRSPDEEGFASSYYPNDTDVEHGEADELLRRSSLDSLEQDDEPLSIYKTIHRFVRPRQQPGWLFTHGALCIIPKLTHL